MSDTHEPADRTYAVLPIKNTVLLPGLFLPLSVGRPPSRAAIVISRPIFVNTWPRLVSATPFFRLIEDHLL